MELSVVDGCRRDCWFISVAVGQAVYNKARTCRQMR